MENLSEKISAAINKINIDSTRFASKQHESGKSTGRMKPFTASLSVFISTFLKNENRYIFRNRMINSYLMAFSEFVKYLKLLKLNKRF